MKDKRLLVLLGSVCLILVLAALPFMAACAGPAPAPTPVQPGEKPLTPIEVKVAGWAPPTSKLYRDHWEIPAMLIEKAVPRAEVTIYPSNTLSNVREIYQASREGIADFGWVWMAPYAGVFSLFEVFWLPGLAPNQATANVVLGRTLEKYPQFQEQISPELKFLAAEVHMRADIHANVPIRTMDELEGMVIGCQSDTAAKALAQMGASASVVPTDEMFTSMERGVIDGTVQAWGSFDEQRMYDVTKYHILISICPGTSFWFMNTDKWNEFTKEEQERLEMLGPWLQQSIMVGNVVASTGVREQVKEMGHEFIVWGPEDMAKMRTALQPFWDEWVERETAKGYPAQDILDDIVNWIDAYLYG